MKTTKLTIILQRLMECHEDNEQKGESIISLSEEFLVKIKGGYPYANNGCSNVSCSTTNSSCTNTSCGNSSGENLSCTNSGCL